MKTRALGLRSALAGINIGTAHIINCARSLAPDDASAVKWLSGYARLLDRPADYFAADLNMSVVDLRVALTDPGMDAAARGTFTGAVFMLRAEFEARLDKPFTEEENPFPKALPFHRAYGQLADTSVFRKVKNAVEWAEEQNAIARVIAKERIGKTVSAAHQFLRRLDTAAWVRVPSGDCLRTFLGRVSQGLGVPCGDNGASHAAMSAKIEKVIGPGKVDTLFLDQAHWLWPTDARKSVPRRWEMVMDWLESQAVNVVLLTTPQDDAQTAAASGSHKHAVAQVLGRYKTFAVKSETLSDDDITAIVRLEAADLNDACVSALVEHCKSESGYLGTLRLSMSLIRHRLKRDKAKPGESGDQFRTRIVAETLAKKGGAK